MIKLKNGIVVAGGSGFVGSKLCEVLAQAGHSVTIVGRNPPKKDLAGVAFVKADLLHDEVPSVFTECDAIVHLAGASIFKRWTPEYKKLIIDSRVKAAEAIYAFLEKAPRRPKVFVSASAVGFYGDRGEETLDESSPAGSDFLASVAVEWERSAKQFEKLGMRTVCVRTAIVLGPGGGIMAKVVPLFRWFVGVRMGSGKQWFSWVHIEDLARIYALSASDERVSGPVNASAPGILRNRDFVRALGRALRRPAFLPAPAFALRLALGEFALAVLGSQKVAPSKLESLGFQFAYPDIVSALTSICRQ